MALSGVHYTLRTVGPASSDSLPADLLASQTMATGATSTVVAPSACLASINASAAIYYAYGTAPDPTNGPRAYYDPANNPREDFLIPKGASFAWILA